MPSTTNISAADYQAFFGDVSVEESNLNSEIAVLKNSKDSRIQDIASLNLEIAGLMNNSAARSRENDDHRTTISGKRFLGTAMAVTTAVAGSLALCAKGVRKLDPTGGYIFGAFTAIAAGSCLLWQRSQIKRIEGMISANHGKITENGRSVEDLKGRVTFKEHERDEIVGQIATKEGQLAVLQVEVDSKRLYEKLKSSPQLREQRQELFSRLKAEFDPPLQQPREVAQAVVQAAPAVVPILQPQARVIEHTRLCRVVHSVGSGVDYCVDSVSSFVDSAVDSVSFCVDYCRNMAGSFS